jgi:hypothetical protein
MAEPLTILRKPDMTPKQEEGSCPMKAQSKATENRTRVTCGRILTLDMWEDFELRKNRQKVEILLEK